MVSRSYIPSTKYQSCPRDILRGRINPPLAFCPYIELPRIATSWLVAGAGFPLCPPRLPRGLWGTDSAGEPNRVLYAPGSCGFPRQSAGVLRFADIHGDGQAKTHRASSLEAT